MKRIFSLLLALTMITSALAVLSSCGGDDTPDPEIPTVRYTVTEEEWIATNDKRTRHSHAIMDGETKGVNGKFSNGLEYPGDPNGAPAEVYNCRCTMTARVLGFRKVR